MVDSNSKRWLFLLSGNVEITHIYAEDGQMIGMVLESDMGVVECFSPMDINATIDRWINMAQFTGSIH
jgi:hypothetical protein